MNPTQAVNQASSLNALAGDLYTDSTRFIYELLQNADDSIEFTQSVAKVWIKIFDNTLVLAHSGSPFNTRDIKGICNVNNGTKKMDSTKTGYKGIGFKSVFGQSKKVTIYSKGEYFRFDASLQLDWSWSGSKEEWEKENGRKFQYPWQIIPIYTNSFEINKDINDFLIQENASVATIIELNNTSETIHAINKLSSNVNMFLFLKKIKEIYFEINSSPFTIEIDRDTKDKITLKKENSQVSNWLVNTSLLSIPEELKESLKTDTTIPDKLLLADTVEISFAAKLDSQGITQLSNNERVLYSYLPTEDTKYPFPFLVNTSFLTSSNRETLHIDSIWNKWLFKMIGLEIFKWIANLVQTDYNSQAYKLLPAEINANALSLEFNKGRTEAIRTIPFILSENGDLIRVSETLIDFTLLSSTEFITLNSISNFVLNSKYRSSSSTFKLAKHTEYANVFKNIGCFCFEWNDLKSFLHSNYFKKTHTIENNKKLIMHFKNLEESAKVGIFSLDVVKTLPFLFDHKGKLKNPNQICLPTQEDDNWNSPDTRLSFLSLNLQTWLLDNVEIRHWLEKIGVQEKTDITYIYQTVLPKLDSYVSHENALSTIKELFSLYIKGTLTNELLQNLSEIKLLTKNNTLLQAKHCYFSDYYKPRLSLENILMKDIFINEVYCNNISDREDWKEFFKKLGVQEGITTEKIRKRESILYLSDNNIKKEYFNNDDQKFTPFLTTFKSESFENITTLNFLSDTENNFNFAKKFWSDFLEYNTPASIKEPATAFWGLVNKQGQISGNKIQNYVPWYIKNIKCLPTLNNSCEKSDNIFLNTQELINISGSYLNIFNGPDLSDDWRAFFNFRTKFELEDYLLILEKISNDVKEDGEIKSSNLNRVQNIYTKLLDQCLNWSIDDSLKVKEWAASNPLLNTKNKFSKCSNLNHFIDGNESIFQEQYDFIKLSTINKNHPHLSEFLTHFNISILYQSQFELTTSEVQKCSSLQYKLISIQPFLKAWIENDDSDLNLNRKIKSIPNKISSIKFYQSDNLKITYNTIEFTKNVNIHFNDDKLYVTIPWNSNTVLLKLSELLCRYFELQGYEKNLDYLLRSTEDEIIEYFKQEGIILPNYLLETSNDEILVSKDFTHTPSNDFGKKIYINELISKAVPSVLNHLKLLPQYDCSNYHMISNSIIGGITKNGNDLAIVVRPSNDNKVLLYYEAELDVLQYVDSELWYVHDNTIPRQLTFGYLLKEAEINKIPVYETIINTKDVDSIINRPLSEDFEFNPIPYVPQKIAMILSSFANTNGGTLIFGLKEISPSNNEFVGISIDFNVVEITNKAISMLSPTPKIAYEWLVRDDKSIFIINVEKSEKDILLKKKKYIRKENTSVIESSSKNTLVLNKPSFERTIAIIIAVEDYAPKNEIPPVKYALNDAEKFKELLVNSMHVAADNIYTFYNAEALKSTLEYDLKCLFYSLTEKDRLIFYYVGHGFHDGISNYLSTYDLHSYNVADTSVSLQKILIDPLKTSKCNNALIFIDACAQSFKHDNSRSKLSNINDDEFILLTNDFPNYSIFVSCQPGQSSYSCDKLENGIWTYHLIDALNAFPKDARFENKFITDRSLNDYLSLAVSSYTKQILGYNQNPRAILDSSHANVIIEIID